MDSLDSIAYGTVDRAVCWAAYRAVGRAVNGAVDGAVDDDIRKRLSLLADVGDP